MATSQYVPMAIYHEGVPLVNDSLYKYTFAVNTSFINARVFCRVGPTGGDLSLAIYKAGSYLATVTVSSGTLDSGTVSLNSVYFQTGDQIEIRCTVVNGTPGGLSIVLGAVIQTATPNEAAGLQMQTPLVARYEGVLETGEDLFRYTFPQTANVFNYRLLVREAADRDITVSVQQNTLQVGTLTIPANAYEAYGTFNQIFNPADTLDLVITQTGTAGAEGQSLTVTLDYSLPNLTAPTLFQAPIVLEYEGLGSQSVLLWRYIWQRDITLKFGQLYISDTVPSSTTSVTLQRNGIAVGQLQVAGGTQVGAVNQFALNFVAGDQLELILSLCPGIPGGLTVSLDYEIENTGLGSTYTYYADPDSEIVLLARQIGIGGKKADAVRIEQLEKYKRDVNNLIDSKLRGLYRVPLNQMGRGNNPWPNPIQYIAQRLVVRNLVNDIYTQVEPNASANASQNGVLAMMELNTIVNKETILEGQRQRPRNYGSNPYTEPLYNPAVAASPQGTGSLS